MAITASGSARNSSLGSTNSQSLSQIGLSQQQQQISTLPHRTRANNPRNLALPISLMVANWYILMNQLTKLVSRCTIRRNQEQQ
jgi:hypothetical protein